LTDSSAFWLEGGLEEDVEADHRLRKHGRSDDPCKSTAPPVNNLAADNGNAFGAEGGEFAAPRT
jgi:hypothetical protein